MCDESGALLIFDEVITGFGRLGSWFATHHYGVTPDMVTFAKAITSGYLPLGGVIVGPRMRAWLEADDGYTLAHGGTYGGHPTCCAAGIANLELMRAEDLPARSAAAGRRLRAGLDGLVGQPGVAEVRGEGLMQAIGLDETVAAGAMSEALLAAWRYRSRAPVRQLARVLAAADHLRRRGRRAGGGERGGARRARRISATDGSRQRPRSRA